MSTLHNFHVPLSSDIYSQLCEETERKKEPATVIAREAIEHWFKQQKKAEQRRQLEEYVRKIAKIIYDLDPDLEAAVIEFMLSQPD